ncbi:hypothetical protein HanRHA438_Chr13g0622431 [Helianthus annuus]|nr:hypothetical protein HanRHA438_Chr13g0622431 [Helianthus annuus]
MLESCVQWFRYDIHSDLWSTFQMLFCTLTSDLRSDHQSAFRGGTYPVPLIF